MSTASPGGKGVSAPASGKQSDLIRNFWIALALGLLALLAYANSFTSGLVLDNSVVIAGDGRIQEASWVNVKNIFAHNYWWPAYESDLYRPLTTLSYMFNYSVLGNRDRVFGYHVINFLLHWANIALVFLIIRRLAGRFEIAALAAAIFAVHPINVESITNIVGRADLLATLAILFGGWCYIKAADAGGWRRTAWLWGAGLNALWGVFAKESAIVILPFVFLYDMVWRWPKLPGPSFVQRLKQAFVQFFLKGWVAVLLPALIIVLVVLWNRFHSPVFGEIFADNPIAGASSWFQGRMTAIKVLGRYLALLVFPGTLSGDYSYNQIPLYGLGNSWQDAQCWLALAVVVSLLGLAFWLRRTQPLLAWGILMFFLMQILTANLLFPIGSIMGERFEYLSSVGYAVVVAQLLWWVGGALSRSRIGARITQVAAAGALAGLLIAALGARTFVRNRDWQDSLSLWKSIVDASPNSFKAYKGYADTVWGEVYDKHSGDTVLEEQTLDKTIQLAERGLQILDTPPLPISIQDNTLYQDLGMYYRLKGEYLDKRGKTDEARQYYQKSLDVLFRARDVDRWVNQTSHEAQLKRGRSPNDIPDVGNYRIYVLINLTYDKLGDWKNAETAAAYVVRLAPTEAIGYRLVAKAYAMQGHAPEAVVEVFQALLLNMNDGGSWNDLIGYYRTMDVKPFPLTPDPQSGTFKVDEKNPLVREELNQACVQLIQRIKEGKLFDDARQMQDTLIKNIRVPADRFNQK